MSSDAKLTEYSHMLHSEALSRMLKDEPSLLGTVANNSDLKGVIYLSEISQEIYSGLFWTEVFHTGWLRFLDVTEYRLLLIYTIPRKQRMGLAKSLFAKIMFEPLGPKKLIVYSPYFAAHPKTVEDKIRFLLFLTTRGFEPMSSNQEVLLHFRVPFDSRSNHWSWNWAKPTLPYLIKDY